MFKLIPSYVWILAVAAAIVAGVFGIYRWGYNSSETKWLLIEAENAARIAVLEQRESIVSIETVTKYKDRYTVITETREKIKEGTRDALQDETTRCTIGPNFIGLHNASATNKAVSGSPTGTASGPTAAASAPAKYGSNSVISNNN